MKTTIVTIACLASLGAATQILLPLYVYPLKGAWDAVYKAASAYPSVTFNVVIGPDSGPGASQYPDSSYISGIESLNSYANIRTLGYVHTSYGSQSISKIESNVSVYAGWKNYPSGNIAVKGIFFDEAPNADDSSLINYMSTVAGYARNKSLNYVVFNPGALTTAAGYYNLANLIINKEGPYSSYSESGSIGVIPSQDRAQSAIVLHDTPPTVNITALASTMVKDGIGAFYATQDCCYNVINGTVLNNTAAAFK